MTPLPFDEDHIGQHATAKVYPRGLALVENGSVDALVRRSDTLHAEVWGSDEEPYQIRIALDLRPGRDPVAEAVCTCPYEHEGWCKHLVAVLLTAIAHPEQVPERPPLADLLARLDAPHLARILTALADADPALLRAIERLAARP